MKLAVSEFFFWSMHIYATAGMHTYWHRHVSAHIYIYAVRETRSPQFYHCLVLACFWALYIMYANNITQAFLNVLSGKIKVSLSFMSGCMFMISGMCWQNEGVDLSHVYLAYTAEGAEEALRPKTAGKPSKSGRPKTANRPKSSKSRWNTVACSVGAQFVSR